MAVWLTFPDRFVWFSWPRGIWSTRGGPSGWMSPEQPSLQPTRCGPSWGRVILQVTSPGLILEIFLNNSARFFHISPAKFSYSIELYLAKNKKNLDHLCNLFQRHKNLTFDGCNFRELQPRSTQLILDPKSDLHLVEPFVPMSHVGWESGFSVFSFAYYRCFSGRVNIATLFC